MGLSPTCVAQFTKTDETLRLPICSNEKMKWHTSQGNLIGPDHPYGLPYEKGELLKARLFVLLSVGVAAALLAGAAFRKRFR